MGKTQELSMKWKKLVVGQHHAIDQIVPYVVRGLAGFNPMNRPVGNFFLMGPTGTGKTRTPETLAEVLHGSEKNLLRVDCGEFQMDHEIVKLIGSPPGYLGHRETHPIFSQAKLNSVATNECPLSIVLFDEIEKASSAMWRILLGILDKATLRLGDNTTVDFSKTLIFFSSNVGAQEMRSLLAPGVGFHSGEQVVTAFTAEQFKSIENIGTSAMARKFSPEFMNRLDEIISYKPLTTENLREITGLEIRKIQGFLYERFGSKAFTIHCDKPTVEKLTRDGTSSRYGARKLKRTIDKQLINPMADQFIDEKIPPGSDLYTFVRENKIAWTIEPPDVEFTETETAVVEPEPEPTPVIIKRTRKRGAY